jgi:metal transporter CNNM
VRKVVLETTSSNDDEELAVAPSSPEQPRLLGRSTFGLFGRDRENSKDKEGENGKDDGKMTQPSPVAEEEEEEDEEGVLSPDPGDEDAPESYAEAVAKGTSQEGQAGPSGGGGAGGAGKKKNRRKKRKGGRS